MSLSKVFDGRGGKVFMVALLLAALLPILVEIEFLFQASMTIIFISVGSVTLICVVLMIIGAILEK